MGRGSRQREVVWTASARDCVDEILGYISEESPAGAAKVLDAIAATAASLAELSERGTVVKELADRSIREVYVYRYRMIYQVASEQVRVLAVIHGAMDFADRLKHS